MKSKTAQRRESMVNTILQRTLVLPLDITPEQYEIFDGLADSYNRMWGSLVSWCNRNRCVNLARVQKENYARLRAKYPELPAQFVCIAIRDAAGAVRSWNSNHPKRRWNLKASRRKKTINYDLRVMSLRGNLLSLSATLGQKRYQDQQNAPQHAQPVAVLPTARVHSIQGCAERCQGRDGQPGLHEPAVQSLWARGCGEPRPRTI